MYSLRLSSALIGFVAFFVSPVHAGSTHELLKCFKKGHWWNPTSETPYTATVEGKAPVQCDVSSNILFMDHDDPDSYKVNYKCGGFTLIERRPQLKMILSDYERNQWRRFTLVDRSGDKYYDLDPKDVGTLSCDKSKTRQRQVFGYQMNFNGTRVVLKKTMLFESVPISKPNL
jgi:hypothetical protein